MDLALEDRFLASQDYPTGLTHVFPINDVVSAAYSPCGLYLAVALKSGKLLVLDASTRETVASFHGHTRPIAGISWSGCSRFVLTGGQDGFCRIWDLQSSGTLPIRSVNVGTPVVSIDLKPSCIYEMSDDMDFLFAVTRFAANPVVVDASEPQGTEFGQQTLPNARILELGVRGVCSAALFLPGYTHILLTSSRGRAYVYDLNNPQSEPIIERLAEGSICSAEISFSRSWIALNSSEGALRVWGLPQEFVSDSIMEDGICASENWPEFAASSCEADLETPADTLAELIENYHNAVNMVSGEYQNLPLIQNTNLSGYLKNFKSAFEYFGSCSGAVHANEFRLGQPQKHAFQIQSKHFRGVTKLENPWGPQPFESVAFSSSSECIIALSLKDRRSIIAWDVAFSERVSRYIWEEEDLHGLKCHPQAGSFVVCGSETGFLYQYDLVFPQSYAGTAPKFDDIEASYRYYSGLQLYDISRLSIDRTMLSTNESIDPYTRRPALIQTMTANRSHIPRFNCATTTQHIRETLEKTVQFEPRNLVSLREENKAARASTRLISRKKEIEGAGHL